MHTCLKWPHRSEKMGVILFALLLSLVNLALPATVAAQQSKPAETASDETMLFGQLDAKTRLFRFFIKVDNQTKKGTLKSLDEGDRDFMLSDLVYNESELQFKITASKAAYAGTWDAEKKSFIGKWTQGGNSLDLNFSPVDKVPADPVKEIWIGTLDTGFQKMKLRFRVYDKQAPHPVLMDSLNERVGGIVGELETEDDEVTFTFKLIRGKFTGKMSEDKKTLEGSWSQGITLPLKLERTESLKTSVPTAPKRPQMPSKPFPYTVKELEIRNESADLKLAATLTIPITDEKSPCVILISGSGAQDRDETLLGHKPFWVIADYLTRRGIAVLRFDDRGTAKSTGDHSVATSADFATDVAAIVDHLKTIPEIDSWKIGLAGHSEGGLIAPMVASNRDDIAFIVMLAGPGVNGAEILKNQQGLILKAGGASEKEIEQSAYIQKLMMDKVLSGEEMKPTDINPMIKKIVEKYPETGENRLQLVTQVSAGFTQLMTPWMKFFLTYEPQPALEKLTCPVLVLNGSKDTQVDSKLNLPAIRKAFEKAGKTDFEIVEYPDLNHLFQKCKTGAIGEYYQIEETVNPVVLKKMATWIESVVR